ncbi:MAG: hypothetical protein ACK4PK_04555 [Alphaproteobacteria bacterium]|jgi:hypothetical protein
MKPAKNEPSRKDDDSIEIDDATAAFLKERARLWLEGKIDSSQVVTAEEFKKAMDKMKAEGDKVIAEVEKRFPQIKKGRGGKPPGP